MTTRQPWPSSFRSFDSFADLLGGLFGVQHGVICAPYSYYTAYCVLVSCKEAVVVVLTASVGPLIQERSGQEVMHVWWGRGEGGERRGSGEQRVVRSRGQPSQALAVVTESTLAVLRVGSV